MRHAVSISLCVLLCVPALLHAEYIEITLPVELPRFHGQFTSCGDAALAHRFLS